MKKLVIIQTVTPDYRKAFFSVLRDELTDARFELYRGKEYFEKSIKTDKRIEGKEIKNIFLLKRKLLFQIGIWHLLFKDVVLVLEMNPRIISNWIFLFLRRVTGRKTVLWGHAWPRKGKNSKTDSVRNIMRRLASSIIVYTNQQRKELSSHMPNKIVYAAPNALIHKSDMNAYTSSETPRNLIYVGRLSKNKKPLFLVKAFKESLDVIPENVCLVLVGDGEERDEISKYVKKHKLDNRVLIKGHINNHQTLRSLYIDSIFSVSPGYVGLSITQSFGFGVPMLISKDEPHSPEIEAAIDGQNALFYATDDDIHFRESIKEIYNNSSYWIDKRSEIVSHCRENYSIETMTTTFINLVTVYGA